MGVALDKAAIVAIFIESMLWGTLLLMLPLVVFLLLRKGSAFTKRIPHLLLITTMFVLCTAHVVMSYMRFTRAFIDSQSNPIQYLEQIADTFTRGKYGVLFLMIFLGDLLLISRCFSLWKKNYFVALVPTCLSLAFLACASVTLNALVGLKGTSALEDAKLHTWMATTYSLTLATKLLCMVLIVLRVKQIHATLTSDVDRHLKILTTMVIINESGAIALFFTVLVLPAAVTNISEHLIFCDVLSPVTGIMAMNIIAGMTIKFAPPKPNSPQTVSHPAFPSTPVRSRSSAPRPGRAKRWDDPESDPEFDETKGNTTPPSTSSYHEFFNNEEVNKSSGTLNTGVVI